MSIDPTIVQRLSQSLMVALEQALAPMQREILALRAEIATLRAAAGATASRPAVTPPAASGRVTATAPAGVRRRGGRSTTKGLACRVPDCPAPVLAKDLCETHYRIMRRLTAAGERFDLDAQRPAGTRVTGRDCSETNCNEPHYAKGLCRRHYMAVRARLRAAEGRQPASGGAADRERVAPAAAAAAVLVSARPEHAAGVPEEELLNLPKRETVLRILTENKGNMSRVAEVLRRTRRSAHEVVFKLGLNEKMEDIRRAETERIRAASLRERLDDVLRREKNLEDLGLLKEIDERTKNEVQDLWARILKGSQRRDEALRQLGRQLGLDTVGVRRLMWRYKLQFPQTRGQSARTFSRGRVRP
jgi:hypothetical protein